VIVSLVQGFIIDIAGLVTKDDQDLNGNSRVIWWLCAGVSSASNVIVFQLFYFAGAPDIYIMVISLLAFSSGIIFAGFFAWETLEFLNDTGLVRDRFSSMRNELPEKGRRSMLRRNVPAVALIIFMVVGVTYYLGFVRPLIAEPYSCEVLGLVDSPYTFNIESYSGSTVTIEAELIGVYIHLPPANYTGVLLSTILQQADPLPEATGVRVMARDGYQVEFDLNDVMTDTRLLLTREGAGLWLIAAEYDGSLWVEQVTTLQVF
jgi:energy-coupling factor transport system substrate-specific component